MAQISLYIDDSLIGNLNTAAKNSNCSVSKFVSTIILEYMSNEDMTEKNKKSILKSLCGSLDDPDFSFPEEIPSEYETARRYDLI